MTVPGSFTLKDVTYRNAPELALLLSTQPGFCVAQMGPAALSSGAVTGLRETVAYSYRYRTAPGGALTPVTVTVPAAGSVDVTFAELVTALNTALAGVAVVDINDDGLRFTDASAPLGAGSFFEVVDGLIAPSLFGSVPQVVSPTYTDYGLAPLWFQGFQAPVAGVDRNLRWNKLNVTEQQYVTQVMAGYTGSTPWSAAVDGVDIAPPIGPAVTVTQQNLTGLSLTTTYGVDVVVNGVTFKLAFLGKATFQELVDDAIAPALVASGAAATVSFVEGAVATILFANAVPGATPTLTVADGTAIGATPLVATLAAGLYAGAVAPSAIAAVGVDGIAGTLPSGLLAARPAQPQVRGSLYYATDTALLYWSDGANWVAVASSPALPTPEFVLTTVPSATGFGPLFTSAAVSVFETGLKPVTSGQAVFATMYYDGVAAAWKYFVNDALVGSVPPVINQL